MFKQLTNYIVAHEMAIVLILIIAIVAVLAFYAFVRKVPFAKRALYYLVCEAEKQFGSGTGELKFAMVSTRIYAYLPFYIKIFISEKRLSEWIEDALIALKRQLCSGMNLKGMYDVDAPKLKMVTKGLGE
jgi:hypothetical protein